MGAAFFASLLFLISSENLHMAHEWRKTDLVKAPAVNRFWNRSIGLHQMWTQCQMAAIVPGDRLVIFYPVWIFFSRKSKCNEYIQEQCCQQRPCWLSPIKKKKLWCSSFVGLTFARWSKHVKMFICLWLSDVSHCKKLVSEGNRNHSFNMLCCVLCTTKSVWRIPSNDEPYFFWNYITWSLTQASIYHAIVVTAT